MEIYRPITVDLYRPYPLAIMNAKQGDTARGAIVTLTAGGSIMEPTTEQVRIYAKKPDGTKVYNDCTIQGGKVKIAFTNQLLAVAGTLPVELEMVSGNDILSTPIFIIQVLPSNIDSQAIESSNEFTALQAALAEANAYKEEYQKKPDAVLDSTQASTDSNTGHLEFQGKPFYPEIPVKQIQNFSYGTVDFETAAEREDISTGETLSSLFGKAKKWFSDLASGAASTLLGKNLDINRAMITDSSGKVAASDVSSTELGYLKGAKKNIQEQIGTISDLNTVEKGSTVGAINELNSNFETLIKIGGAQFIENGASLSDLSSKYGGAIGSVGITPNNKPSVGIPSGYLDYGTLFWVDISFYKIFMYIDVGGHLAIWNINDNRWSTY